MKIHHLNCGTLCPFAASWVTGGEAHLVCHCLLIELGDRLVLIDSGFGTDDVHEGAKRMGHGLLAVRGARKLEETALEQVKTLGFNPSDVTDIVLTHMDFDHAGGLADFPHANVHVHLEEHKIAMLPDKEKSLFLRERYRKVLWKHGPSWKLYAPQGEAWFGFDAVRELEGLPPEILLIPLHGHTHGHCGVAVKQGDGWILHAGDAYFHHSEMKQAEPRGTLVLNAFQKLIAYDDRLRRENQARLREAVRVNHAGLRVFCAHDTKEFRSFS